LVFLKYCLNSKEENKQNFNVLGFNSRSATDVSLFQGTQTALRDHPASCSLWAKSSPAGERDSFFI
jgi:hypothetical protein